MLSAHHLGKTYGIQTVLQDISLNLSAGERVGLIGPNGCGKTTLLRILAGLEPPESGSVAHTRPDLRLGYLPQGFDLDPSLTLAEALAGAVHLEEQVAELATALSTRPDDPALQEQYDQLLAQLSSANVPPENILVPLGLADLPLGQRVGELSGGQKTRLLLARLLLEEPNLLLLDEPTNHLDIAMLKWLEAWLEGYRGAALIVSHDRAFLDNTVTRILEMDPRREGLHEYAGNYTDYFNRRQAEIEGQWASYRDQQAEIRRLQADIVRTKAQALRTEREAASIRVGGSDYKIKGYKSYQQGIAKKVARKAKSREKRLEQFLESDEIVARPRSSWQIKLDFAEPAHKSREALVCEDLAIGYPGSTPLLTGLRLRLRGGERLALTGPNGCGKTTLLRTIAGQLEPLDGSVRLAASARLGYMAQEQEQLDPRRSPLEIIQETGGFNPTNARSFLHAFLFSGQAPLRPCGEMSYGERTRLQLALLIAQGCTFLLLDEPINHLDIPSRAQFEQALSQFAGTVLAVVHDRYFIEQFATSLWEMEAGQVRVRAL
ncbi:MAG: ABC-F family ATP-binding cassette domain-containing protein [Anaerolineales bacterium]|nr:ABC-F family ATP-binding cassette domain-containing protein [Anaerolineales bacterium]